MRWTAPDPTNPWPHRSDDDEPPRFAGAACDAARSRIRAFLAGAGSLSMDAVQAMRAHLAECPACDAHYHDEAEFVARLGRESRRTRERKGVPRQGRGLRWNYLRPPRQTRLRLVLIPAFVIFLLTQSDRLRQRAGWRLEALDGAVVAAEESVPVTATSRRLITGETCSTGPDGSAVLRFGDTRLVLGPATDLVLGVQASRSIRILGGRLVVGGNCRIQTALALIDVDDEASARIEYAERGLVVECLAGPVRVQDVTGTRTLAPGDVVTR